MSSKTLKFKNIFNEAPNYFFQTSYIFINFQQNFNPYKYFSNNSEEEYKNGNVERFSPLRKHEPN